MKLLRLPLKYVAVLLLLQMNGEGIEIEEGLVGYWPFDGHAADVIYDNHGRAIGSVSYVDGSLDKAVYLDGENSIIQIGDEEIGLPNALPPIHAASFWVRAEKRSGYIIYTPEGWYASYQEPGFLLGAGHQTPRTLAWTEEEPSWHHVVVQTRYELGPPLFSVGEMYVDGELIPPAGLPPNNRTYILHRFPSFFYIGGDRKGPGFRGTLDELVVWNRGLEPHEVKQLFQLGTEGRSVAQIFRDIDDDGLPDVWEIEEGLDETIDGTMDLDGDGLDNDTEWRRGLNPWLSDTDGDGLLDSVETETNIFESNEDTGTNPRLEDSDGDHVSDNDELFLGTNPNEWDSDQDGFGDGDELQAQSNPLDAQKKPNVGFGLEAYWSFDHDLNDFQGRYEGVIRPDGIDVEFAPGVLSKGVKLNGENLIEVPTDQDDFAFANRSFTMACWVKIEDWAPMQWPQYLLSHQKGRQWHVAAGMNPSQDDFFRGWYFQVEASDQALREPRTDGYLVGWNTHSQNWQHIACVYISPKGDYTGVFQAKPQVYLNGIRRKWQSTGSRHDEWTPFALRKLRGLSEGADGLVIGGIGNLEGVFSLNGVIDDLAIWSRAVTESEILAIYNASVNAGTSIKHLIGADSDSDGMPDSWETENGLFPLVDDSADDPDNDGLTNREEFGRGTSPGLADTDQDGFSDLVETNTGRWVNQEGTGSNPLMSDSDGDGLLDGLENPAIGGSNPNQIDSDSDGVDDRTEKLFQSDAASNESIPRPEQGLLAYWPFENGLEDRVGVHNGTFHGGKMSLSRGQFGNAIRVDGVDDAIEVIGGTEEDFDFIEQSFSVSLWFRADKHPLLKNPEEQFTDYGLLSKGRGNEIGLNVSMSYGRISYSGTRTLENISIGDGIMHHFVGIVDVTRRRTDVYLDGRLISTGIPKIGDLSYRLWFGTHPDKIDRPEINREEELYYWAGLIDDVAIWKRPLAFSEIKALYESGKCVGELAGLDPIEPEPVDPELDENRDRDGDGVSDVLEKIAGTNPEEAAEYFRITSIDRVGEGLELTWTSVIGKDYILEYTRDLKIAAWEAVGEAVSATEGTRETRTIDSNPERIGAPSGYYRVRVVNLP